MAYTLAPLFDDVARVSPATVSGRASRQGFAGAFVRAIEQVEIWMRRADERRQLLALDDHMLADIGVDRASVLAEADKPFWMS